jgi:hypothetical protein
MRHVLMLCLTFGLTIGVGTATAGGGNSANAKLCQKGGWQVRRTGQLSPVRASVFLSPLLVGRWRRHVW